MKKIVKEGASIERFTLPREEAIKLMQEKDEPYKVELIEDLPEGEEISFYQMGEFVDLCAGPHLMTTKPLKAMKLTSSSGAYWRGSEKIRCLPESTELLTQRKQTWTHIWSTWKRSRRETITNWAANWNCSQR